MIRQATVGQIGRPVPNREDVKKVHFHMIFALMRSYNAEKFHCRKNRYVIYKEVN